MCLNDISILFCLNGRSQIGRVKELEEEEQEGCVDQEMNANSRVLSIAFASTKNETFFTNFILKGSFLFLFV
jgi:hypothetical protein